MNRLLFNTSATTEMLTAVALFLVPGMVIQFLFGFELSQHELIVPRVLGVSLLSLGISTWTMITDHPGRTARVGLCIYNVGVAGLLLVFGMIGETKGVLLWPVTGIHGLFGAVMFVVIFRSHIGWSSST